MSKTSILLLQAFLFLFSSLLLAQRNPTLNIIIINMDDMGYGDINAYHTNSYSTINMDAMAAAGMKFTQFYSAQAVCSASRTALLTGCYPNRLGISGALMPKSPIGLNPREKTIASLLKEKGYRTCITGKWHLGSQPEYNPCR
jgi:arylsulfatase